MDLDRFIGAVEDIVITKEFQDLIESFMDKYHEEFDYGEENKLSYTGIFHEYRDLVESFLVQRVMERFKFSPEHIHEFEIQLAKKSYSKALEDEGEVVELILSLTDFLVFKELVLDHKRSRNGEFSELHLICVTPMK